MLRVLSRAGASFSEQDGGVSAGWSQSAAVGLAGPGAGGYQVFDQAPPLVSSGALEGDLGEREEEGRRTRFVALSPLTTRCLT